MDKNQPKIWGHTSFAPQHDLLSENRQLHKKLEAAKAQQRALDIKNGELKCKAATLEKDKHVVMYDLHVAQNANLTANTNLQSMEQCLQEVKTQATSLAKAVPATAVTPKAFLEAASQNNAVEGQKQYVACNSAVNDVIWQYHAIMGTNSDVVAANNSNAAITDDNDTGASNSLDEF